MNPFLPKLRLVKVFYHTNSMELKDHVYECTVRAHECSHVWQCICVRVSTFVDYVSGTVSLATELYAKALWINFVCVCSAGD